MSSNVNVVAGGAADTQFDVAGMTAAAIVTSALNDDGTDVTDITSTITTVSGEASGTLTLNTAIATDDFVINGVTYTLDAAPTVAYTSVAVGADDTETAANIAAAITGYNAPGVGVPAVVKATSALGVVTITAGTPGTAGNAITTVGHAVTIVAGAATLEDGSATGGIKSSGATDSVTLHWYTP